MNASTTHKRNYSDNYIYIKCPLCNEIREIEDAFDTFDAFGMDCEACSSGGTLFLPHGSSDPYVWIAGKGNRQELFALLEKSRKENQCMHSERRNNKKCVACNQKER